MRITIEDGEDISVFETDLLGFFYKTKDGINNYLLYDDTDLVPADFAIGATALSANCNNVALTMIKERTEEE